MLSAFCSASPSPTAIGVIFVFGRIIVVIIIIILARPPSPTKIQIIHGLNFIRAHLRTKKEASLSRWGNFFTILFPNFNAKKLPSKADKKSDEVLPLQCDRDIPSNK